jgi:hypothetical protein
MNCLDNLIGIHRSCNEETPSSGLYIQDLSGITLSVANAGIGNETISGLKLIEDKITFSQNAILAALRMQLANKIRVNSIINNDTAGFYKENLTVVNLEADKLKGIVVKANQYPYLEFYLSTVYLKLATAVTTNVYVYDLMTNTLLDTIEVTTVARTPVAVTVNKAYQTKKQKLQLFICVDSSVANTYETNMGTQNCSSCASGGYSNRYISFSSGQIETADQKIDSNITSNTGTNGLSINYSLNCSLEPFLCNMGNQIAWSLLHKVGAEIMDELIASRRLNSIVTIDKATNELLRERYNNEYMASMSALLANIQLPNDICFNCNSKIRKAVAIP